MWPSLRTFYRNLKQYERKNNIKKVFFLKPNNITRPKHSFCRHLIIGVKDRDMLAPASPDARAPACCYACWFAVPAARVVRAMRLLVLLGPRMLLLLGLPCASHPVPVAAAGSARAAATPVGGACSWGLPSCMRE